MSVAKSIHLRPLRGCQCDVSCSALVTDSFGRPLPVWNRAAGPGRPGGIEMPPAAGPPATESARTVTWKPLKVQFQQLAGNSGCRPGSQAPKTVTVTCHIDPGDRARHADSETPSRDRVRRRPARALAVWCSSLRVTNLNLDSDVP
jgi:hypothetical protein